RLPHNPDTPGKTKDDHAGHIFGDRFGGSGALDNLVSQAQEVNLKAYKAIEDEWAKTIKSGGTVENVEIKLKYKKGDVRPGAFEIKYKLNGVNISKTIKQ
ncbi:MAG: DNA/RNA non-specific endonuclease, partial [Culicoidibacterales bacterium]